MLQLVINYMVTTLTNASLFGKVYGLVSLITVGEKTYPALYKPNGKNRTTELDPAKWFGVAYFRKNGPVSFSRTGVEQFKPCAVPVQVTIPIKLVCTIKKSELNCDDEFASDELAMYVGKLLSDINSIRTLLKARRVTFNVDSYITDPVEIMAAERQGLDNTVKSEYAYLSMDIEVQIDTTKDCMFDYCNEEAILNEDLVPILDYNNVQINN